MSAGRTAKEVPSPCRFTAVFGAAGPTVWRLAAESGPTAPARQSPSTGTGGTAAWWRPQKSTAPRGRRFDWRSDHEPEASSILLSGSCPRRGGAAPLGDEVCNSIHRLGLLFLRRDGGGQISFLRPVVAELSVVAALNFHHVLRVVDLVLHALVQGAVDGEGVNGRMIFCRVSSWATTAPTTRYPKTQGAALSSRMGRCSRATCSTRDGSKTGGGSYGKEKEGQRLRHRDTCP